MLGEQIKTLRKEMGLTQVELGKKLGMTGVAVNKWELGQRTPSAEIIKELASIFNVTTDFLLNDGNRHEDTKEYDNDALEILHMLDLEENSELKILFKKTGNLTKDEKKKVANILKAVLADEM